GGVEYWRRPGKAFGISATVNYAASDLLYVFSSNADPLEEGKAYTKFTAYTVLDHDGDFEMAALRLRAAGYGMPLGFQVGLNGRCRRQRETMSIHPKMDIR